MSTIDIEPSVILPEPHRVNICRDASPTPAPSNALSRRPQCRPDQAAACRTRPTPDDASPVGVSRPRRFDRRRAPERYSSLYPDRLRKPDPWGGSSPAVPRSRIMAPGGAGGGAVHSIRNGHLIAEGGYVPAIRISLNCGSSSAWSTAPCSAWLASFLKSSTAANMPASKVIMLPVTLSTRIFLA